jgi:hemerythrin-like domain-containing protein
MKRHRSLHPLSEHHHHVLVQALEIARAAKAPGPERDARLRKAAESLLRFWERDGQIHFREEEEQLLPAFARHVALNEDPDVMRMLADHARIRAAMQDVRQMLDAGPLEAESVISLGQSLHDHVRLEEDKIFPRMEAVLTEDELVRLGPHLTRLHSP